MCTVHLSGFGPVGHQGLSSAVNVQEFWTQNLQDLLAFCEICRKFITLQTGEKIFML